MAQLIVIDYYRSHSQLFSFTAATNNSLVFIVFKDKVVHTIVIHSKYAEYKFSGNIE